MTPAERARVVVVGGGIAGLSAALALQDAGLAVTLVEERARLGGVIATERVDGLLLEGGPDALLTAKPAALEAIARLGLTGRVVAARSDTGGPLILWRGRLTPMPDGLTQFVPTRVGPLARTPLLSPGGKLRLALELARPVRRGDDDESLGAFFRRRLGRQAYERLVEPLLGGIYGDDLDALSLLALQPRLRELELQYGGLARAGLAQRRSRPAGGASPARPAFVSLRDGLGELVDGYRAALRASDLRVGCAARRVARDGAGYRVELADGAAVRADALVLATPAPVAAELLRPLSAPLAGALREIPYGSTATVALAYATGALPPALATRGVLVPRAEGRALRAITCASGKFDGRAPDGVTLLRCALGRGDDGIADLPDGALEHMAQAELAEVFGVTAPPRLTCAWRWSGAMPRYTLGHLERLARIEALLAAWPTLALVGAGYRGVGVPDGIGAAAEQAHLLAARLTARARAARAVA